MLLQIFFKLIKMTIGHVKHLFKINLGVCAGAHIHSRISQNPLQFDTSGRLHICLQVFENIPIRLNASVEISPTGPRHRSIALEFYYNKPLFKAFFCDKIVEHNRNLPINRGTDIIRLARQTDWIWSNSPKVEFSAGQNYFKLSTHLFTFEQKNLKDKHKTRQMLTSATPISNTFNVPSKENSFLDLFLSFGLSTLVILSILFTFFKKSKPKQDIYFQTFQFLSWFQAQKSLPEEAIQNYILDAL